MSKRTRDRQLAKLAARRQAERRAQRRRREVALGVIATLVAVAALVAAYMLFFGGDEERASPSPTASATPSGEPGTQTGTVTPQPAPAQVACGAEAPAAAGRPKPQFSGPPPTTIDEATTYTATMRTSCGAVVIELDAKRAPATVNSFVFLARQGYFDGQYFHRLDTSIDVVQGGDPTGTGSGGPGYSIPDELTGEESYGPGVLAMANAGANTGGSQFFLITGPNGHNLDANPNYTIFGSVVRGLDVARRIQQLPIQDPGGGIAGQQPTRAVYIEKVTIAER
jgi:cyclophilin family peptidyl-prolyl cis-trans isomerase